MGRVKRERERERNVLRGVCVGDCKWGVLEAKKGREAADKITVIGEIDAGWAK